MDCYITNQAGVYADATLGNYLGYRDSSLRTGPFRRRTRRTPSSWPELCLIGWRYDEAALDGTIAEVQRQVLDFECVTRASVGDDSNQAGRRLKRRHFTSEAILRALSWYLTSRLAIAILRQSCQAGILSRVHDAFRVGSGLRRNTRAAAPPTSAFMHRPLTDE